MAHRHMAGYAKTGTCELVAVADLNRGNAEAFVAVHGPGAAIHEDYRRMMEEAKPDVVSVCLWPHLHGEVVCAIAPYGPKAIHCEKPMDIHWDACLEMDEVCRRHGVQLTFNHQRRFNLPFIRARELLDRGTIGRLRRLEAGWHNLFDSGTHWIDMMFFFNRDEPARWVLGQLDLREGKRVFGALHEGQGIATFGFRNGVRATYFSGRDHTDLGCMIRAIGEEGVLEILDTAPWVRVHRLDQPGWADHDPAESIHDDLGIHRAIEELIACLQSAKEPLTSSRRALQATEVIFATYESSRQRRRIDLPLPPGRSGLLAMAEAEAGDGEP
jgi:predicted dehydrogenase